MIRSGFKPKSRPERVRPIVARLTVPVNTARISAEVVACPKEPEGNATAAAIGEYMDRMAALGCSMCYRLYGAHAPGPVDLHHLRGNGWGRGDYKTLMPLCFNHHRGAEGIHHIGVKLWEREMGVTQLELLAWTLEKLNLPKDSDAQC